MRLSDLRETEIANLKKALKQPRLVPERRAALKAALSALESTRSHVDLDISNVEQFGRKVSPLSKWR